MIDSTHLTTKPEDLGIDSERLEAVFARAKRDVDDGMLPAAQVAVARHGKLAGMRSFGSAVQGGVERPATDETLFHFFSSTKAVVASAVVAALRAGSCGSTSSVADIIPEFATNGKDVITVEHRDAARGRLSAGAVQARLWDDREKLPRGVLAAGG